MMKLTDNLIIKKLLIISFFLSVVMLQVFPSQAADFIVPNSSGEPVTIDISGLDLIPDIEVTIGNFPIQPRPYRTSDTKSLVVFPPPLSSSEKTLTVKAGNSSISKTISFRSSPTGILKNSLLPDLEKARGGNSITKLSDGRVVLIGGSKALADDPLNSIEIFDPEAGKSELLKSPNGLKPSVLKVLRSQHTATYLGISNSPLGMIVGPVEQILVVGGFSQNGVLENSIEIVEIKVGTLQGTSTLLTNKNAKLKKARVFHTASLLPDGTVLIIGGQGRISMATLGAINSIELFDPLTRLVQSSGISLNTPRLLHTATTLQNGNILITGGFTNDKQDEFGFGKATEIAELIDVSNLSIKKVGTLINNEGIGGHSAVLLTNGLVLITGGSSDFFSSRTKDDLKGITRSTVQFYDPSSEVFNPLLSKSGGNQSLSVPRFLHQSLLLPNGNIAILGGLNIKAGGSSTSLISTPVSTIEIFNPELLTFSGASLKADKLSSLETATGRILPSAILVTPKNKIYGLLSASDSNTLINCAVYLTGGFTNGLGRLPSKISELIQIESIATIEGRKILLSPDALIRGSYLSELLVNLDKFSKVPSIKVEPQTVNLSTSNSFMANIKVLTSNNEVVLLKAETTDPNNSVIISPSLFQVGENVTVNRKDSSVAGEFEITILPADAAKDFISAKVKVNISDSSKPFLSTVPGFGVSLATQSPDNSDKVQVKVFSQDGASELTSIPSSTQVTATIANSQFLNLGGIGISSVIGTLATQFPLNAVKPGSTSVNFTINFPDVLPVSIPVEVTGTPLFSSTPIDASVLTTLLNSGVEVSNVNKVSSTTISLEDIRLSTENKLFPLYVPINLQSSVDNSNITGLFTIRPIFGIDLLNSFPRTFVNAQSTAFKSPLPSEPTAIGGIVLDDETQKPLAFLAASDGIRSFTYEESISKNLDGALLMINGLTDVKALKPFDLENTPKIAVVKGSMLLVIDDESGDTESSATLSADGLELELTEIDNQTAAVVSTGIQGVNLVLSITDEEPRVVNFQLPGNTKNISVVKKLGSQAGPFVVAYDGLDMLSIVNLLDVNASVKTINAGADKISKIDYAGRFTVNGMITDVLIGTTQRGVVLFDLNNLTSIPINDDLKIKNKIEDLLVIDGIAYLALGVNGISALSVGALIDSKDTTPATIATFKKNKFTVVKSNGKEEILTKTLNANKLADSKPFLLSTGLDNNLTVIRVSP